MRLDDIYYALNLLLFIYAIMSGNVIAGNSTIISNSAIAGGNTIISDGAVIS